MSSPIKRYKPEVNTGIDNSPVSPWQTPFPHFFVELANYLSEKEIRKCHEVCKTWRFQFGQDIVQKKITEVAKRNGVLIPREVLNLPLYHSLSFKGAHFEPFLDKEEEWFGWFQFSETRIVYRTRYGNAIKVVSFEKKEDGAIAETRTPIPTRLENYNHLSHKNHLCVYNRSRREINIEIWDLNSCKCLLEKKTTNDWEIRDDQPSGIARCYIQFNDDFIIIHLVCQGNEGDRLIKIDRDLKKETIVQLDRKIKKFLLLKHALVLFEKNATLDSHNANELAKLGINVVRIAEDDFNFNAFPSDKENSQLALISSSKKTVKIIDLIKNEIKYFFEFPDYTDTFVIPPSTLALQLANFPRIPGLINPFENPAPEITTLSFPLTKCDVKGNTLCALYQNYCFLYDLRSNAPSFKCLSEKSLVTCFTIFNNTIFTGHKDFSIRIWNIQTGEFIGILTLPDSLIESERFNQFIGHIKIIKDKIFVLTKSLRNKHCIIWKLNNLL